MSKALDREMAKLAAMGITITTTARAGEDSIAGRIQSAAERHGIAGGPTQAERCRAGECPPFCSEPHVSGEAIS